MATHDNTSTTLGARVAITGMAFALGSKVIPIREKVRTIHKTDSEGKMTDEKVDPADEFSKAMNGLGIESSSVAGKGEDIITCGTRAVLNLCFLYGLKLNEINTLTFATESPEDASRNHAIEIVKEVNKISAKLLKAGIEIGELDTMNSTNHQSACVAGVASLSDMAFRGVVGKAIIVTSDDAKYQLGSKADETGGFGATAILVEDATVAKRGLFISNEILGHYSRSVPDFLKPILNVIDERLGVALVNKYPIVFGEYSEYVYLLDTYKSMKKAFAANSKNINDFSEIKDNYVLISHTPYPKMPEKSLAYLLRHFAHKKPELEAKLEHEMEEMARKEGKTAMKEPLLDGFSNLETTIKFIVDVEGFYVHLSSILESTERMNSILRDEAIVKVEEELRSQAKFISQNLIGELKEAKVKFAVSGELLSAMDATIAKLELLKSNEHGIANIKEAFEGIHKITDAYIKLDKEYNKAVRKTETFKQLAKEMHIEESVKYSRRIGNIYTGSSFIALMSYLASNTDEWRTIGFSGFGSGSQSHYSELRAQDVGYMVTAIQKNAEVEFKNQAKISAEEYEKIRCSKHHATEEELIAENSILHRISGLATSKLERFVELREQMDVMKDLIRKPTENKIRA